MKVFEQFSLAFDAAPSAMLIADDGGHIVFTNNALDNLFEYERGMLLGQGIEQLVPAHGREKHTALRAGYLRVPQNREMGAGRDLFGVTRTGVHVPVEIGLSHFELDQKTYVIASVVDLTSRRQSEEMLRLAVDSAASAMIMSDDHGTIVLANTHAHDIFGYALGELVGAGIDSLLPEALRARHQGHRSDFSAAPSKRAMGRDLTLMGQRKDGSEFPLEIGLTPIDSADGALIMATVIDITERQQQTALMRRKNVELKRLNKELAQFAYSASHDLKAPLASVEGLLGCIEADLLDQQLDSAQSSAVMARRLTRKLKSLIESILGVARAGTAQENNAELSLAEVVADIYQTAQVLAGQRGVALTTDVETTVKIRTQPARFRQIIENLVYNGIHYADSNKSEPFVKVGANRIGRNMVVSVEDNGIGIPAERQAHVFEVFKRFGNHKRPGHGLGLALVKTHVDQLGGEISFCSSPNGTTFSIELTDIEAEQL
ncbi:MAG: PAS domain S-box protein [Gammaproteobacteria bacterium]